MAAPFLFGVNPDMPGQHELMPESEIQEAHGEDLPQYFCGIDDLLFILVPITVDEVGMGQDARFPVNVRKVGGICGIPIGRNSVNSRAGYNMAVKPGSVFGLIE
jgi:hypothetical protein